MQDEQTNKSIAVSVVIPAYNEELRVPATICSVCEYLRSRGQHFEVLLVDDASQDRTQEVALALAQKYPELKVLEHKPNRGKGFSVRQGVLAAQGARILFTDADGSTPIEELERLEAGLALGAKVAIGSRALRSKDTKVAARWYRVLLGRVFNGIVNFLVVPGVADTQCGFKLFEREAAHKIFALQKAERFSFDVEVLFLASKFGYPIEEVSVNWHHVPGSSVNLVTDSLMMFVDVIGFRLRDLVGGYKESR